MAQNQVVVFHQTSCSACEDYLPRFKRIAVKYRAHLNIQIANLNRADRRIQDAASTYKISGVPTTLVLDATDKVIKRMVGAISDKQIESLFTFATKGG
jgi:thiol-disulfide isomerase/thioredoxin